jgi:hypothetical protein
MQAVQLLDTAAQRLCKQAGSGSDARRTALHGLSTEFHDKLPAVLEFPWNLATGADLPSCCHSIDQSRRTNAVATLEVPCHRRHNRATRCRVYMLTTMS